MYSVSNNYIAAVRAKTRQDRLKTTLTFPTSQVVNLTDDDYDTGSISIEWQCVDGEELMFGAAYTRKLNMSIRTTVSRYQFYEAILEPTYEVLIAENEWESVPLGVFSVVEATRVGTRVKLTAYDNMRLLDVPWSSRVFTGTPYEVLEAICAEVGLTLATTTAQIASWPNVDYNLQIDATNGCSTLRDGVKCICQLLGAFACINRSGELELRHFHTTPDLTLTDYDRYKSSVADYSCNYVGLRVTGLGGTFSAHDSDPSTSGLLMIMNDAAGWDRGETVSLQTRTNRLFAYLQTIVYTPVDLSMPNDPSIDCGDMLTVQVGVESINTLVTSSTWSYRKAMTIESVGQNPYFNGVSTSAISSNRILTVQGEQNKVVMYSTKNADAINVSTTYEDICKFAFATIGDTDALFYATIKLTATPAGPAEHDVTLAQYFVDDTATNVDMTGVAECDGTVDADIRYLLNNEPITYAPHQIFRAGTHTQVLFFPIIGLEASTAYTWQVQMKCDSGSISIEPTDMRAVMWGQKLSAHEIPWDGVLNVLEQITPVAVDVMNITVVPLTESNTFDLIELTREAFAEVISEVTIVPQIPVVEEMVETVLVGRKNVTLTIATLYASTYTFNATYVNVTEMFTLRGDFTYLGTSRQIDSGHLTGLDIPLTNFASATNIELTAVQTYGEDIESEDGEQILTEDGTEFETEE